MSYTKIIKNKYTELHSYGISELGLKGMSQDGVVSANETMLVGEEEDENGVITKHRINFKLNMSELPAYTSVNSVKLKLHLTSGLTSGLKLCSETSLTSDNGEVIDTFKGVPTEAEIDLTKHVIDKLTSDVYFSIRTTNSMFSVYSLNASTVNLRPEVTLEVVDAAQGIKQQKYILGSVGRGGSYRLNVRNGKLNYVKELFSYGGNLMPLNLSLVYNVLNVNSNVVNFLETGMPKGWMFNYSQYIKEENGYLYLVDSSGDISYFALAINSTNKYYETAGSGLIITKNSDNTYTLKDGRNNYLEFNSNGLLTKIRKEYKSNKIETTITYVNNTAKIAKIVDGMGHVVEFTYGQNNVTFKKDDNRTYTINYDEATKRLKTITEPNSRVSTYTFNNEGYISAVMSDNNDYLNISYDELKRVSYIYESVFKSHPYITKSYELEYESLSTVVKDNFDVKEAYNFTEDGELLSKYEIVGEENKNFSCYYQTGFEEKKMVIDPNNYKEFIFNGLTSQTITGPSINSITVNSVGMRNEGSITITPNKTYYLVYNYEAYELHYGKNNRVGVELSQNGTTISFLTIPTKYRRTHTVCIPFTPTSTSEIKATLIHNGENGRVTFSHVRIYQNKEAESELYVNKYTSRPYFSAGTETWFKMDNLEKFTYGENNTEVLDKMYEEDFKENLKNVALGINEIWYNHKTKLIDNATNVRIYFKNVSNFLLETVKIAKVTKHKEVTSVSYSDYTNDSNYENMLRINYTNTKVGSGSYFTSYVVENKDFEVIKEKNYDGSYVKIGYDGYGNVVLEENRNVNDSYYMKKSYTYLDNKYLASMKEYRGANIYETTYTYDTFGNLKTVTNALGQVITNTYNNLDEIESLSASVSGVINKNNITYSKDLINKLTHPIGCEW